MSNIEKTYEPQKFERSIYETWEREKYFHTEANKLGEAYCIVIPPPNVTGQLHMGHALDETLQDILIRWHRSRGNCHSSQSRRATARRGNQSLRTGQRKIFGARLAVERKIR